MEIKSSSLETMVIEHLKVIGMDVYFHIIKNPGPFSFFFHPGTQVVGRVSDRMSPGVISRQSVNYGLTELGTRGPGRNV